jgi:hypothetical protein
MNATYLVEWNGDEGREEFNSKQEAVDYATHIISGGYSRYICVEEYDGRHWNVVWERCDDVSCDKCADCRYGHDDEEGWVLRNDKWLCGVCVNDPVEVDE